MKCKMKKTSKWMDVKKNIPPINLRILFCDERGWMFTGYFDGENFECSNGEEPGVEIKYWRFLPKITNLKPKPTNLVVE